VRLRPAPQRLPRARTALAALLLSGVLANTTARAEGLYVIEQLVVSVNSAPGGGGERVTTLHSGERVEVIERVGEEVHVRLAGGRDGWIRASYLSADEPLRPQLAARSAEVARLKQQLEQLQAQLVAARAAPAASQPAQGAAAVTPADDPPAPRGALFTVPQTHGRPGWIWVWVSALVCLGAGFALGWRALDKRIRAKYGGLRIY
jgi:SH3-like domain-containing protein